MSIFAYTLLYITNISKYYFDFVVNYISKFTQLYQILIWADIFFSVERSNSRHVDGLQTEVCV